MGLVVLVVVAVMVWVSDGGEVVVDFCSISISGSFGCGVAAFGEEDGLFVGVGITLVIVVLALVGVVSALGLTSFSVGGDVFAVVIAFGETTGTVGISGDMLLLSSDFVDTLLVSLLALDPDLVACVGETVAGTVLTGGRGRTTV